MDAAEAVCSVAGDLELNVLEEVALLVDKSLLRQQEQAEGEPLNDLVGADCIQGVGVCFDGKDDPVALGEKF